MSAQTSAPVGWIATTATTDRMAGTAPVGWQQTPAAEPMAAVLAEQGAADVSRETSARQATQPGDQADTVTEGSADEGTVDDEAEPAAGPDPEVSSVPAKPTTSTAGLSDQWTRPASTRVLTVANQKGGVGKTTTTVNLAAALAQHGLRVLVIDTDPQGNASTALGIDHHAEVPSVYEVLVDDLPMSQVIQEAPMVPGLFCVPATIDLAGAEIELVSLVAREQRLGRALRLLLSEQEFDYVLIDCPPSLGLLTVNAFVAAAEVLIPIQCEYYALEGLSQLLKNVEMIRTHLNPDLTVSTILLTMFDGRTRLASQVAEEVRGHFPDFVLRATVPRSVRISEAPSHGQTVMTYDPSSSGALSYADAAHEITERPAAHG